MHNNAANIIHKRKGSVVMSEETILCSVILSTISFTISVIIFRPLVVYLLNRILHLKRKEINSIFGRAVLVTLLAVPFWMILCEILYPSTNVELTPGVEFIDVFIIFYALYVYVFIISTIIAIMSDGRS